MHPIPLTDSNSRQARWLDGWHTGQCSARSTSLHASRGAIQLPPTRGGQKSIQEHAKSGKQPARPLSCHGASAANAYSVGTIPHTCSRGERAESGRQAQLAGAIQGWFGVVEGCVCMLGGGGDSSACIRQGPSMAMHGTNRGRHVHTASAVPPVPAMYLSATAPPGLTLPLPLLALALPPPPTSQTHPG